MDLLHSTYVVGQKYAGDAYVYGLKSLLPANIESLTYAQEIIEAKWLGEFPLIVFLAEEHKLTHYAPLYDEVKLVYPDDWNLVSQDVEVFLINAQMLELCKQSNPPYVNLDMISTSDGLDELFKSHMFVVAAAQASLVRPGDDLGASGG